MAISERLRAGAAKLSRNLRKDTEAAERKAAVTDQARTVLKNSENPTARARARQILARAEPGTGAGQLDGRKKTRTQRMFDRAERVATVAAPIDATLDPMPDPQAMWAFAMASPQQGGASGGGGERAPAPGASAELAFGHMADMAMVGGGDLLGGPSSDPDWGDNPDHLDTPAEVRASLQDSGLDPMGVDTKEGAMSAHFLVHGFADDADLGGRTPAQLEAEHDLTVDAMLDFGVGHHSPMDNPGGAFQFTDPWGLTGDDR